MSVINLLDRIRTVHDRLKQAEYTGENRCIPCTVVNIVLTLIGTGILAMLAYPVAVIFFLTAVVLIYTRGYLIPGTPTLTRRFLPDQVLALFDHHRPPEAVESEDELDLERILWRADAVTDAANGDDLQLIPSFRREWYERMAQLREREVDRAALAPILGTNIEDITFKEHENAFVARIEGQHAGQWESRAAFLADVAGGELLADWSPDWRSLSVAQRSAVLSGLRVFLTDCPTCGGPTTLGTDTVESCCRSIDVIAVSCEDCGTRLFEEEYDMAYGNK